LYDGLGSTGNTGNSGGGKGKNKSGAGGGNNLEFHIKGWGVVKVVNSNWNGAKNTWVELKKSYMYDGDLAAKPNGLDQSNWLLQNAFTSPVLVE
jgi:hypothetical protein